MHALNLSTHWNESEPVHATTASILYSIRKDDLNEGLLFDSVTMSDVLEDSEALNTLDALVVQYNQMDKKITQMKKAMNRAVTAVRVLQFTVSEPFKQKGVTQVASIFELTDGQTVTVYFHNPDRTPNKLTPTDEVVSWKWLLNKKDITIIVAPEQGKELNPIIVGQRIMMLAEKNSPAFIRRNGDKVARLGRVEAIKNEVGQLQGELTQAQADLADILSGKHNTAIEKPAGAPIEPEFTPAVGEENSPILDVKEPNKVSQEGVDVGQSGVNYQALDVKAYDPSNAIKQALKEASGDLSEAVKSVFKTELQGRYINTKIGKVLIMGASWQKLKQNLGIDEIKSKTIPFIPDILMNGSVTESELYKERKDGFIKFYQFEKAVELEGMIVTARLKVGEKADHQLVYHLDASEAAFDAVETKKPDEAGKSLLSGSFVFDNSELDTIMPDDSDGINLIIVNIKRKMNAEELDNRKKFIEWRKKVISSSLFDLKLSSTEKENLIYDYQALDAELLSYNRIIVPETPAGAPDVVNAAVVSPAVFNFTDTAKQYQDVTVSEFLAGQKVSYIGLNGKHATAQFKQDSGVSFIDIQGETKFDRKRPVMSALDAENFFNNLGIEATIAEKPSEQPQSGEQALTDIDFIYSVLGKKDDWDELDTIITKIDEGQPYINTREGYRVQVSNDGYRVSDASSSNIPEFSTYTVSRDDLVHLLSGEVKAVDLDLVMSGNSDFTTQSEPIVVTGKELEESQGSIETPKDRANAVFSYYMERFVNGMPNGIYSNGLGVWVKFDKTGAKKTKSFSGNPKKAKLVVALDKIIAHGKKTGEEIASEKSSVKKIIKAHFLKHDVMLGDEKLTVRVVIHEKADGTYSYDHDIDRNEAVRVMGGSSGALDSVDSTENSRSVLQHNEPSSWHNPNAYNLPNTLDSVNGSRMVLNLFIDGEELEVVENEEYSLPDNSIDVTPQAAQENKENNNIDAMKYFENPTEMTGEQLADKFFKGEDSIFRKMVLSGFSTAMLNSKISSMIHKDAGYYSTARSFVVDSRIVSIVIGTTTDISKDKNINAPFYIQVFDAATNKKSPKVQFGINNEPYQIVEFVAQQVRSFANEHESELSGNFPSYESMSPKAKEAVNYVNEMQSKGYKSRGISLSGAGFGEDVVSELIQDYVKGGMSKSIPFDYSGKAIDYFGVDGKPTLKYDVSKVSMPKQKPKTASEWMSIASNSAAVNDVRLYLNGTHISPDGKMVSTDGHRMTIINGSLSDFNAVIESAGGIPKDGDASYKTKHDDGYTIDNDGNFVGGTFPEWQRALPREPMSQSDIYPIDILKLAAHAKSTTKIGSKVGFKLNPVNIELGDSIVMVNSRYAKEAAEIFIKAGYKKATAYAGSQNQLVIVSPDKKITHVIMGMKVDHSAFEPINATTATLDSSNEFSEFEDDDCFNDDDDYIVDENNGCLFEFDNAIPESDLS